VDDQHDGSDDDRHQKLPDSLPARPVDDQVGAEKPQLRDEFAGAQPKRPFLLWQLLAHRDQRQRAGAE
jgi:hypothetical protein